MCILFYYDITEYFWLTSHPSLCPAARPSPVADHRKHVPTAGRQAMGIFRGTGQEVRDARDHVLDRTEPDGLDLQRVGCVRDAGQASFDLLVTAAHGRVRRTQHGPEQHCVHVLRRPVAVAPQIDAHGRRLAACPELQRLPEQ